MSLYDRIIAAIEEAGGCMDHESKAIAEQLAQQVERHPGSKIKPTADDTIVAELVALAEAKGDERVLDDDVHDTVSETASDTNNGGFEDQIRYLLGAGSSADEIRTKINE